MPAASHHDSDIASDSASDMAASYHTSLLTATDCRSHIHLVIGSNSLAGKRCEQSLAAGAKPILLAPPPSPPPPQDQQQPQQQQPTIHYALARLIEDAKVQHLAQPFDESLLFTLGRPQVNRVVDAVFITSTATAPAAARAISDVCKRNRIPVNVVDAPALCSFTLLSTHTDGPLQIGITTNGRGCHLASRIRRDVAASLPPGLGAGCARLGEVRRRVQSEDCARPPLGDGDEEGLDQAASFNRLVTAEDRDAARSRRMRWLAQVCEYWPLKRLAAVSDDDVEALFQSYAGAAAAAADDDSSSSSAAAPDKSSPSSSSSSRRRATGRLILAGSGPGHPDLLTRATHKAILAADEVLADKLVPAGVLDLVPRRTPVTIARKFPGNADAAQAELLQAALAGVAAGRTVLRLKQGDPFVYGRGGEEVAFFAARGLAHRVSVLPGVTSALSAPLFAAIPPTQRDVADQILVCTGTGKQGAPPAPPEFVPSRTCVFLMALHRIDGLVAELTARPHAPWPPATPCAVVERASCPDQRVIRTTLAFAAQAVAQEGSRPPGLLVVGRACEALCTPDRARAWSVEEGFKGLLLDADDDQVVGDDTNAAVAAMAALG